MVGAARLKEREEITDLPSCLPYLDDGQAQVEHQNSMN